MMQRNGFSLLELALVLALLSLMLSFGMEGINSFSDLEKAKVSQERLARIEKALAVHATANDNYPCPARLDRRPNNIVGDADPEFGEATCDTSFINVIPGGIQAGAVPVRALNLPDRFAADGWGNKFSYIVTTAMTNASGINNNGVLNIRYGDPTNNNLLTAAGAYLVVSHGRTGNGATGAKEMTANSCIPGSSPDSYNCSYFTNSFYDTLINNDEGSSGFFDDYVVWRAADNGI